MKFTSTLDDICALNVGILSAYSVGLMLIRASTINTIHVNRNMSVIKKYTPYGGSKEYKNVKVGETTIVW